MAYGETHEDDTPEESAYWEGRAESERQVRMLKARIKALEGGIAEFLEAYDDNYDASCEPGKLWSGGSHIDTSVGEALRTVLSRK